MLIRQRLLVITSEVCSVIALQYMYTIYVQIFLDIVSTISMNEQIYEKI